MANFTKGVSFSALILNAHLRATLALTSSPVLPAFIDLINATSVVTDTHFVLYMGLAAALFASGCNIMSCHQVEIIADGITVFFLIKAIRTPD